MATKVKMCVMLIIIALVVFFIDNRVRNYDLFFYSGKDDGFMFRILSICILSTAFFFVLSNKAKLLMNT